MRGLWIGLLSVAPSFSQAIEHPIPQPNSYGWAFDGPALALECVGALKTGAAEFPKFFAAKPTAARRACLDQLFQSLTPEPDFTSDDFFTALTQNPNRNLAPRDPKLSLRIGRRIGVNLEVAKAIGALAAAGLLDDSSVLSSLVRCLDYPLISVGAICQETLFTLTGHDFARPYDYYRKPPNTKEGRQRLIADWKLWQQQMQHGHQLLDDRLRSLLVSSLADLMNSLMKSLSANAPNNVYLSRATPAPRMMPMLENGPNLFGHVISRDMVAGGWGSGSLTGVGVRAFRPGLNNNPPPDFGLGRPGLHANPQDVYRERFPFLDLEIEVTVVTSDVEQRNAAFGVVKKALDALRRANRDLRH